MTLLEILAWLVLGVLGIIAVVLLALVCLALAWAISVQEIEDLDEGGY